MAKGKNSRLTVCFLILFFPTVVSSLNKTAMKEQVLEMFRHAYWSYMNHAYPADELMPLSCAGRFRGVTPSRGDVDDALGNFALTLVDSLDTLVVVGEYDEFERAVGLVVNEVSFEQDVVVSVFETNIRIVGGLLGGHLMAKVLQNLNNGRLPWYKDELLRMAHEVAERLLPAFNTTSGVPFPRVNLKYGLSGPAQYLRDQHETCTACGGTMILEFAALSRLTGNKVFEEKARKAMDFLWQQRHRGSDLMGTVLNVHNGDWIRRDSGVGAGIDSYYEYCLKGYILLGDESYLHRFNKHYAAVMKYISQGPLLVDVHMHKPTVVSKSFMDALLAFWPGLQVLKGDLKPAIETHELLYQVVQRHNFLPEAFTHDFQVHWGEHPLRPEFVESTYFLYKATKDPHYLEVGKEVIDSLNKHVRVGCGFAGVKDVRTMTHEDRMDSFVLAETFKYLYLLFAEREELIFDPDDYIFTTEAHFLPLSISSYSAFCGDQHGSSSGSLYDNADDADKSHEWSCPNTRNDFDGELTSYARLIRSRLKGFVGRLSPGTCEKKRMKASEFDPTNPEHIYYLKKMGISLVTQSDGKMQLVHAANAATSAKDAEEGLAFMQEMIQAAQQSDQSQMFYHPPRVVQIVSPPVYGRSAILASPAQFGYDLSKDQKGVIAPLVAAEPYKACSALVNEKQLKGKIALIERGACMFIEKCRRAQVAGAVGVVIVDNKKDTEYANSPVFAMSGDGSTDVKVPAVFVFGRDSVLIKERMNKIGQVVVRLGQKLMNPATVFTKFLQNPTEFQFLPKSSTSRTRSDRHSTSSTNSVRLGDVACYELDDSTIRCSKMAPRPTDTMNSETDKADTGVEVASTVVDTKSVSPPPLSNDQTDHVTTFHIPMTNVDRPSRKKDGQSEKTNSDRSETAKSDGNLDKKLISPPHDQNGQTKFRVLKTSEDRHRNKEETDDEVEFKKVDMNSPEDLDRESAASVMLLELLENPTFQRLNANGRFTGVVNKLWKMASKSSDTGKNGENGEERDPLKEFSSAEKELLIMLARKLNTDTEERTEDEKSTLVGP